MQECEAHHLNSPKHCNLCILLGGVPMVHVLTARAARRFTAASAKKTAGQGDDLKERIKRLVQVAQAGVVFFLLNIRLNSAASLLCFSASVSFATIASSDFQVSFSFESIIRELLN
jgi:hypothetical protein